MSQIQTTEHGKYLGRFVNAWRRRTVAIYEHATQPGMLVTVGRPFDGGDDVVCVEPRNQNWEDTLRLMEQAERHGKTYVYK